MPLDRIEEHMLDSNFTQKVNDNSNKIGVLSGLQTTEKGNIVGALNETVSQLAEITTYLRKYYVDDFSTALTQAINAGYKKIIIDGEFEAKTLCSFTGLSDISLIGKCSIKLANNIDTFIKFTTCNNISIDTIKIDGQNYENYYGIWFNDCVNVSINHIEMKNIRNLNVEKGTYNVFMYCKNYFIGSAYFENILANINTSNIGTGKGSVQNIFISVDSTHYMGNIGDVHVLDCHNIDYVSGNIVMGDYDAVKLQPYNFTNPSINAMLVIDSITGYNFGKRLLKCQNGGVTVNNLKAYSSTNDAYSCFGIHNSDVTVENIHIVSVSNSFRTAFELGYLCDNINISNVNISGGFQSNVISYTSTTFDSPAVYRTSKNVSIENIVCNITTTPDFLSMGSSTDKFKLKNINGTIICSGNFVTLSSSNATNLDIELANFRVSITAQTLFKLNAYGNLTTCKFRLDSSEVLFTGANASGRIIHIPMTSGNIGDFIVSNTKLDITNATYQWGYILLDGFANVHILNSILNSDTAYSYADIKGDKVIINNVTCSQNYLAVSPYTSVRINSLDALKVNLTKGSTNPINCHVSNCDNELYVATPTDVIINSTKIFSSTQSVTLTNGVGSMTVTYPFRMTSIKFVGGYVTGNNTIKVTPNSLTSYTSGTFDVISTDTGLNTSVNCTVLYTY